MEVESIKPRQKARELSLIALYIYQLRNVDISYLVDFKWYEDMCAFEMEELPFFVEDSEKKIVYGLACDLLKGVISNIDKIDEIIKKHLVKWSFERVREIDKAILRISIYSIVYLYDIPSEAIISEANRLATLYSEDNAPYYINGILHKVNEEFRGKLKDIILKQERK
ncbi:MAG: transcription antitermination factor NusB [Brevinematia bacterium]